MFSDDVIVIIARNKYLVYIFINTKVSISKNTDISVNLNNRGSTTCWNRVPKCTMFDCAPVIARISAIRCFN